MSATSTVTLVGPVAQASIGSLIKDRYHDKVNLVYQDHSDYPSELPDDIFDDMDECYPD